MCVSVRARRPVAELKLTEATVWLHGVPYSASHFASLFAHTKHYHPSVRHDDRQRLMRMARRATATAAHTQYICEYLRGARLGTRWDGGTAKLRRLRLKNLLGGGVLARCEHCCVGGTRLSLHNTLDTTKLGNCQRYGRQ